MFQAKPKKRARRRAYPIHGYVGPNGSGKSFLMVWDTLPSLEAGRVVLSTVRLLDYENPRPCEGYRWSAWEQLEVACELCAEGSKPHRQAHRLWEPFTKWDPLLDDELEHFDVLMDEVAGVAHSRDSMSMPSPVANRLQQLRRRDITLRWTSPGWDRSDKIIRQCSQAATLCVGYAPKEESDPDGQDRLWRNRRLFRVRTYDAQLVEQFTEGKRQTMDSFVREWVWGPGSVAFAAYDTLAPVLSIGTVTEGGTCYRCGGRRSRPMCKCDGHGQRAGTEAAQAGSPAGGAGAAPGRRARRDPAPALVAIDG